MKSSKSQDGKWRGKSVKGSGFGNVSFDLLCLMSA